MAKEKSRYFTFLLYPESIPLDWEMKLELLGVPMAISPLHDKDLSKVEGQKYKKAHYHVIYVAKNPVTSDSVRDKIKRSLGNGSVAMVQIVATSMENMYLYLTHESKDAVAKNKHKYEKKDIKLINNFDIDRYVVLDATDKKALLNEITKVIMSERLENIFDLSDYIVKNGSEIGVANIAILNEVLLGNTGLIKLYFDGAYQRGKRPKIDKETGEIF
ncbi:Replication protein [Lactococcus lactis subsp. lactis]|uniref:Replication protein n=2 Tax=Lactococcus lactis TaxID=1358 RepID=A0A2A5S6N2_LACLH|nr:replication protein [Lactococcus lactis]KAA8698767.1 replication protein RepB [Lactococcus lactis subsp. hordniae]KSU07175.1 Replication protein [Lactococcus lactis subsp. lactis]MCT3134332.1 replication protein RepB [Lactococcus lactis]PCS09112.1 replication protein [Lactococcus lactis subsp. hordniae]